MKRLYFRLGDWRCVGIIFMGITLAHMSIAAPEVPKEWQGHVVLMDFWASWCTPCRQSFPWMQRMTDKYHDKGLMIVAVNLGEQPAAASRFLTQYHPTFTVQFDPRAELGGQYPVHTMPTAFLIDRQGVLRMTHVGFRAGEEAQYEAEIIKLLNEERQ
jgi:cytochrome c biogenesis protein CcmG/thiol:disulfide interchange protein DsbE